jgi:hypothetical protein
MPLDHRAHRAVQDQDAALELLAEKMNPVVRCGHGESSLVKRKTRPL